MEDYVKGILLMLNNGLISEGEAVFRIVSFGDSLKDTGECIFCKTKPHDLSCPNNPNKGSAPFNKDWKLRNKIKQIVDEYHRIQTKKGGLDLDGWIDSIMDDVSQEIESARASERERIIEIIKHSPSCYCKHGLKVRDNDELLSKIEK